MSLQDDVNALIAAERGKTFAAGPQWSLGQLIDALAPLLAAKSVATEVVFDFCGACPDDIGSWRGSYAELAISFNFGSFMPLGKFVSMLKGADGATFDGYKGGEFRMSRSTPVWVANWGNSGNTGVVGVRDAGWQIVIETAWCEF
jgi:hypothetical protein